MNSHLHSRRDVIIGGIKAFLAAHLGSRGTSLAHAEKGTLAADGISNDLPEIERLIAAAESKGGGTIKLPEGRFLLDPGMRVTALTLPAKIHLEGAGNDRTVLIMAPNAQGHVVNAPYGWVEIANLTIDGNANSRHGRVGHNLRVEGERVIIDRVVLKNATSYGLAIGQRRFAKNVSVTNVEILNAGDDGIDIKNKLGRTEGISLSNIVVRGFGRPAPSLPSSLVGTRDDRRTHKAAVDLRGNCVVNGLEIVGVLRGRDGLRFRQGEPGDPTGPGAHGARAENVIVESNGDGSAIAVFAHDVQLRNIKIRNVLIGLRLAASNSVIEQGSIRYASRAAILAASTRFSRPAHLVFRLLQFISPGRIMLADIDRANFDRCEFLHCQSSLKERLTTDPNIILHACQFDQSCAFHN